MNGGFGAVILDPLGHRLSAAEKALFAAADPFGFILFARNIDTPDQVRALCDELRAAVGRDAPVTIDQEGGRVQRLRAPLWREWLPPLEQMQRAGPDYIDAMYIRYRLIAEELRALGIDSNCAPMVDIATPDTHAFLKNRCYGDDPAVVARAGRAAADGMLAGGVLPVLKHIPGHGRAQVDSHFDLPVVSADARVLGQTDFTPFALLSDLPMAMTAHVVYSAFDTAPATLSPRMIEVIRRDIGFDGLIMTDDIAMKALSGGLTDLSRAALDAGCDVVLHCNGSLDEKRAVLDAAGRLSEVGQRRALRALSQRRAPDTVDIAALAAKLEALLNGRLHV